MGACNASGPSSAKGPKVMKDATSTSSSSFAAAPAALPEADHPQQSHLPKQEPQCGNEKLQEANALQRPKTELHTEGKVPEPFQAKSEADAEKRRLAERQERLLLKVRCDEEAGPEEKLRDPRCHSRIEAAETKEAKAEMNLKEVKGGAVMEEKLQELKGPIHEFLSPGAATGQGGALRWKVMDTDLLCSMRRVASSPGFELNGINHNLLQAGSQGWESRPTELKSFLQIFSIRLESQEAALSEATREVRRSSDRDLQKRFDTFLEQESERAHLRLEKAAARNVKPDEQVQQSLELRLQEMESHLSSQERLSSKPAPTSDAAEQAVRVHGPDTGLRRSLQSLEERFSAAQARQTRSEMTAQQALAQARQLEAILTEFNVEDHSFQGRMELY
eukprot:g19367.t1